MPKAAAVPTGPRSAATQGRVRGASALLVADGRRKNVAGGIGAVFLGAGAYRHHVPAAVDHLIQRGEFLTSYTPYQPEIAQGTLQALFEFQTQVALLTGMEVANASLYDGSTATAEAVMMAHRLTRRRKAILVGRPASALCRDRAQPCAVHRREVQRRPITPATRRISPR